MDKRFFMCSASPVVNLYQIHGEESGSAQRWFSRRFCLLTKLNWPNAPKNAIQACEKVPSPKRYNEIKSIIEPCFMLQIRNSFHRVISFDEEGSPLSAKKDHGFGTRSIATFCDKYDVFYAFLADKQKFTPRLIFS